MHIYNNILNDKNDHCKYEDLRMLQFLYNATDQINRLYQKAIWSENNQHYSIE
nr:MAG TPA: hypothetical protein [Caudoviricetes sp.]